MHHSPIFDWSFTLTRGLDLSPFSTFAKATGSFPFLKDS